VSVEAEAFRAGVREAVRAFNRLIDQLDRDAKRDAPRGEA
jgi:hypothetical protein